MESVGAGDLTMCSGRHEDWESAGASGPPLPRVETQERWGAERGGGEVETERGRGRET